MLHVTFHTISSSPTSAEVQDGDLRSGKWWRDFMLPPSPLMSIRTPALFSSSTVKLSFARLERLSPSLKSQCDERGSEPYHGRSPRCL